MKIGVLAANTGLFALPAADSALAEEAEAAGFESLWTAEHVLWPTGYRSTYPYAESGRMPGHRASPSWLGKEKDLPTVHRLEDMTFGERV